MRRDGDVVRADRHAHVRAAAPISTDAVPSLFPARNVPFAVDRAVARGPMQFLGKRDRIPGIGKRGGA